MFSHELLPDGYALRGAHFTREGGSYRLILVPRGYAGPQDLGGYTASRVWRSPSPEEARAWLRRRSRWVHEGRPSEWAADLRTREATPDEVAAVEALAGVVPA